MRIFIRNLDPNDTLLDGDERHRHLTTEQIYDNIYRVKTNLDDLFVLQDFVLKVYNQINKEAPTVKTKRQNFQSGAIEEITTRRKPAENLPIEGWLDFLIMVRLLELGFYSAERHEQLKRRIFSIASAYNIRLALGALGEELAEMTKDRLTAGDYENHRHNQ